MGYHRLFGGGHHGRSGRRLSRDDPNYVGASGGRALGKPKPILWVVVLAGVAVWSLIAWAAYVSVDPFLGWLAASLRLLTGGGVGTFFGQLVDLLRWLAKPAILAVWAIGGIALLAAPFVMPMMSQLRGRFRH